MSVPSFVLGIAATLTALVVVIVTFPVWWLLSGGDLEMHHWLFDGDGSVTNRWHHRGTNGR